MDGQRIDTMIRTLTRSGSRRAAVRALSGSALATFLATFGRNDAAAKCVNPGKKCKSKGKNGKKLKCCGGVQCKGGKCRCAAGLQPCGNRCIDLLSDLDDCGQCGNACGGAEICYYGHCCVKSGPPGPHHACCSGFICNPPGQNCVCA
jgi:hypothetical protein